MVDTGLPLIAHFLELRRRLMWCLMIFCICTGVSYVYAENLFQFLVQPLADCLGQMGQDRRLIYTGLTEVFLTYVKIAVFSGLCFTFPVFLLHVWAFVAPGLYTHEKRLLGPVLVATPLLFFGGCLFAYYGVFPRAYGFFLSFESAAQGGLPIQLEARVGEYLTFVMHLVFAFGFSFELPILLVIVACMGRLRAKTLVSKWRIAVTAIVALSAFITPPDLFSMIALALPLIILYGFSIGAVAAVERYSQLT